MKTIAHTWLVVPFSLACLQVPADLAGQDTARGIARGSRVRVTSPVLEDRLEGTVVALDDARLVVGEQDPARWLRNAWDSGHAGESSSGVTIPREQITKLEVYRGSKGHAGLGALIGAGVFAVGGAVAGAALDDWSCCWGSNNETDTNVDGAVGGAIFFGAVGAGLGALVGLAVRTADWEEVELPTPEPLVSLAPQRDALPAFSVGVRLRL